MPPTLTLSDATYVRDDEESPFAISFVHEVELTTEDEEALEIPDSFLEGMADFQAGRVADLWQVTEEPPPE